jgi:predicted short-subunit dehydrogenase-like oxidoreductase (DUF2520 family)
MTEATPLPTLHLIGCGKLGKTLARLWHEGGHCRIGYILTRQASSAKKARDFIGSGTAISQLEQLSRSNDNHDKSNQDIWLLAQPDNQLSQIATDLANLHVIKPGDCIFHCSGATSASILSPLQQQGAVTASIHPIHSFATPEKSLQSFAGSYCAYEGDSFALAILLPLFENLKAKLFEVNAEQKTLYHAGSVMACNYLVALLEASFDSFAAAGVDRQLASELLAPLVHQTADNVFAGTETSALTGPISRGDHTTITAQQQALDKLNPQLGDIYRSLGLRALAISEKQQLARTEDLDKIQALFMSTSLPTKIN